MRDLSLAAALAVRGARCVFAVDDFGRRLVKRFASGPVEAVSPEEARGLAAAAVVVVVDDFWIGAAEQAALKGTAPRLVVIDDLADRATAADLLVDPSLGRTAADYAGLARAEALLLLGPEFALLRPAFAALRPAAPPSAREAIGRVFVSFGLSDIDGVTARAVAVLAAALPQAEIDVALGPDASSLPALRALAGRRPGVWVTVAATDVAERLARADLAVGAGGSATWERACLGAPTISVVVADNQRDLAQRLAADGRLVSLELAGADFEARFAAVLESLRAPERRRALAAASWALCDGRGADRVADALLAGL